MADLGLDAHLNFDQLGVKDDSDDEEKGEEIGKKDANLIHIRVKQRNGRKCITTIQGLNAEIDMKKVLKACKKSMNCNGTVVDDEKMGQVIQLQGDKREEFKKFIVENELAEANTIKVHGHG